MAIVRDQEQPAGKTKTAASGRPVYEKGPRPPRGRKAVYVDALTQARAVQAAAELGTTVNDMAEAALTAYLKQEAAKLFEREFEAADRASTITIPRWEFEKNWRPPAWTK